MTTFSKNEKTQRISELIELNDELENYFKNTIIPQLFVDSNFILRKYTPPAMKQFNFTPEDIGKPFTHLVNNIRYSTIIDDVKEVIESGEIFEKEIQTNDLRWFQMNIIPYLIEKENRSNGVIITFVDITERIKTLRDLEKLNASHETFIYSVSHDLKAPLANIEGLIDYLRKVTDPNHREQQQIATLLKKSVDSMRNIIDELAEIAKAKNHYQEEKEIISLENIFNEVKLILDEQISNTNATIHLHIKEPEIKFSQKSLRSIIFNLLSNALKYKSPERAPDIHLKSERVNGYVQISVKDNGLGIAEDKIDKLFKPYSRLEKKVEGTGIGLYLIKRIIENQGGQIIVKSNLGEGTEFIVKLRAQ